MLLIRACIEGQNLLPSAVPIRGPSTGPDCHHEGRQSQESARLIGHPRPQPCELSRTVIRLSPAAAGVAAAPSRAAASTAAVRSRGGGTRAGVTRSRPGVPAGVGRCCAPAAGWRSADGRGSPDPHRRPGPPPGYGDSSAALSSGCPEVSWRCRGPRQSKKQPRLRKTGGGAVWSAGQALHLHLPAGSGASFLGPPTRG